MEITIEISYYPLMESHQKTVDDFIHELTKNKNITVEPGIMSSLLTGRYEDVMGLIDQQLKSFMENYPSVFILKISNACKVCEIPVQ